MRAAVPAVEVAEVRWTPADPGARAALLALLFGPVAPVTGDPSREWGDSSTHRESRYGQP
ncbi:MAG: hypothetical protein M3P96_07645 [Actinomycetota bacterium]|nr:hypothetical protein [Actinomycetota bacterium]